MDKRSIFSEIVKKEDSYTKLLCALMVRSKPFRDRVLGLLLTDRLCSSISTDDVRPHVRLPDECGCPDISIQTARLRALVEVKTDPARGLTTNQRCDEGDVRGYSTSLRRTKEMHRWLVFLVPKDWAYLETIKKGLKREHRFGIKTNIVYWHKVLATTQQCVLENPDPVLEEFRMLLSERYGALAFSSDEVSMLFSKDHFPVRAVRKLEELVKQIAERAKKQSYRVEVSKDKGVNEDGFYLRLGPNSYFWFGVWTDFGEESGFPLCFGYDDRSAAEAPKLARLFKTAYRHKLIRFEEHSLGIIPQETLEGEEAASRVWDFIAPVLDAVWKARQQ